MRFCPYAGSVWGHFYRASKFSSRDKPMARCCFLAFIPYIYTLWLLFFRKMWFFPHPPCIMMACSVLNDFLSYFLRKCNVWNHGLPIFISWMSAKSHIWGQGRLLDFSCYLGMSYITLKTGLTSWESGITAVVDGWVNFLSNATGRGISHTPSAPVHYFRLIKKRIQHSHFSESLFHLTL